MLGVDELACMIGCTDQELRKAMPTVLSQKYPYAIELKASMVLAGCQRVEPCVEQWLDSVERTLRTEGFLSTDHTGWEDNQYFQFIRSIDANTNGKMIVKAFLNGSIIVEAIPWQQAELANSMFRAILSKHSVSYEALVPEIEKVKGPTGIVSALVATVGIFVLCSAILNVVD